MEKSSAIVVLSDLHLGAGKDTTEFEHFEDDAALSEFLEYYGSSSVYSELELILAGDFFDSIQVKVEGQLPDRVYAHHALAKIKKIISGHSEVFAAFRKFLKQPGRSITFLLGNHDPASIFSEVQNYLRNELQGDLFFESNTVIRPGLHVKHGNEWDAANRFPENEILSSDVEGQYVRFPWGSYLVIDFISRVRGRIPNIDKIKPIGAFIRWATLHRPKDAILALLYFIRFILRYRFHPNRDQRVYFGRLRKILRGTCYSCDLVQPVSDYLEKMKEPTALVVGHTHRALLQRILGLHTYVNVGTWNPILVFKHGEFSSAQYRTYALFSENEVKLLQWDPGRGASAFETTFYNIHMHSPIK